MPASSARAAPAALLVATSLLALAWAFCVPLAGATSDYSVALGQPCIACHTTSTSPDLNARGVAFAAVSAHREAPIAAWNQAVQAHPLEAQPANSIDWVPLVLLLTAAGGASLLTLIRRRARSRQR